MVRAGWVALGGAAGAVVRVGLAAAVPWVEGGWPWSTLAVNLAGAFALGVVVGLLDRRAERERVLQPLVAVGFLGALTTMSSFVLEVVDLAREHRAADAAGYAGVMLAGGLVAAWLGLRLARRGARQGAAS